MRVLALLLGVLVLGWASVWAEPLDLTRAKKIALERNPQLRAAQAQIEAAQAGVRVARSRFFPRIDLREVYQRSDSPVYVFSSKLAQQYFRAEDFQLDRLNYPSPRTDLVTELSVTQPIFNRGREIVGYRKARLREEMAHLLREGLKQRILFETERAYLELLLARKRTEVVKAALDTARANLQTVKSRVEAGTALRSDLLQAEVYVAALEREFLAVKNQVEVARSRLNVVLGMPLETVWEPKEVSFPSDFALAPLPEWQEKALKYRPDLLLEETKLKLAGEEVRGAKFNFWPAVNLRGVYEYHSNGVGGVSGDAFTVWAQFDFNLFNGFGDRARLAQARAQETAQAEEVRHYRRRIKHEVEKAYLEVLTARKQVQVTKAAVAQAEEGLRLVEKRYREGLTIIVELLDAQTALKRARLNYLDALYAFRLAFSELLFRTGSLGEEKK